MTTLIFVGGQLIEDDDYQDWIKWVEVEENERITSYVLNPILSIQTLKFGNSFNSFGVSLNGNRWMDIPRFNSI